MIRYREALNNVEEAVEAVAPGWLTRAEKRAKIFEQLGSYSEKNGDQVLTPFWGEAKPVFMARQYNKCIYCESLLEGGTYGPIQWDLEHFRPKGRVRKWPGPSEEVDTPLIYDFPTGGDLPNGYFRLAYCLRNYAASCKSCNSCLKSDYFPIAGNRIHAGSDPSQYEAEHPYLIYPLEPATDPTDLISFNGPKAVPKPNQAENPSAWRRAQVIIDFFNLNREDLDRRRSEWLYFAIWSQWQLAALGNTQASGALVKLQSDAAPFAGCSRCFVDLCNTDFLRAEQIMAILHRTLCD
jgi:hypothetical protein